MNMTAVIFDMDGLLLDSERLARAAFVDTCGHFGVGDQTALFMQCVGTNQEHGKQVLREGLRGKADDVAFGQLWNAKCAEYMSDAAIPLKSGAAALLQDVRVAGIPTAVATSTPGARATRMLRNSGILQEFNVVVAGDQVQRSKPLPDIYLRAAELLAVRPDRCLALEDSENGVRSALAAGMTVIQVPDLVEPSDAVRALGHTILGSLHEVREWYSASRAPDAPRDLAVRVAP
ncbi:MAG: HAD family phosphatase [Acidobacteria bacterium]|nr:HAD family phosphatase [Acidobacteriota bacterium]